LYDINKLGEDIFMHILNDVYDLNLQNANDILHDDFPSIDLVDEVNKKVIQVTSTTTLKKARDTVEKLKDLKFHKVTDKTSNSLNNSISFFRQLKDYENYELSFLYIKEKPNITEKWKELLKEEGLSENNILGIDDIVKIVQSNSSKCQTLYKTIQQRMDSISFKFNIDSYFESFEPHLADITSNKFKNYKSSFTDFIQSNNKIFEIYAVGGNGKSHLLKYFASIETEYIPLIFTKQINIEEDLKKLDSSKKYLFIFDDIDRFLDQPILLNLLSYTINNENIKLILSYRTASKNVIKTIFRRYNQIESQELEVIWEQNEIESLIHSLLPDLEKEKITRLAYTFNNNPYLITQAIRGDVETIKAFSQKIVDDTRRGLEEFDLSDKDIKDLLFRLSLIVPISEREIEQYFDKSIIQKLEDIKILRKLVSKYRFNPDIQGDLYLANYIDANQNGFDEKIEELFPIFSDTLFTNLSYALVYNESDSLQNFIKKIINRWISNNEYRNDYLALINKIVYYAPMESFIYLDKATKKLEYKKTGHHSIVGESLPFVGNFAPPDGDWSSDSNAINLESIEPIISKLIYALKNNISCEELSIEHIIRYLTSKLVVALPSPYYDNQTLDSIFKKIVSPLDTRNFDVILKTFEVMEKWLDEIPINTEKVYLLKKAIESLLSATFDTTSYEGVTFTIGHTLLNLEHQKVLEIIEYAKNILLKMVESENGFFVEAIDIVENIGGHGLNDLDKEHQSFYKEIKKESLIKLSKIIKIKPDYFTFYQLSKINEMSVKILRFEWLRDLEIEALSILEYLPRTNEFIFYEMIRGVDFLIINFDDFKKDYVLNKDNKDFWFDSQSKRRHYNKFSTSELEIIKQLSEEYQDVLQVKEILNNLDMSTWNSYQTLLLLLSKWFEYNSNTLSKLSLENIDNQQVQNVLNEFMLINGLNKVKLENINDNTPIEDLKVFLNSIFNNYNSYDLEILKKIVDILSTRNSNDIRMFISIISQKIYFTIANNIELYSDFEPFIIQFLDWQLQYNFDVESYITHHILHDTIFPLDRVSLGIKNRLEQIVRNNKITIKEFELKPLYRILGYELNEVIEILYNKLVSKKEDGIYRHHFMHYFDHSDITEVLLIKSYLHSYEDFKFLVDKTLNYYLVPVETVIKDNKQYELRIHLDYFLKYAVKQEYIQQLFDELVSKNDIEKIKSLYSIVPVSYDYLYVIISNLNLLEDEIEDNELINYLSQVGKIKSWSRSHMENSDLVLSEEALFTEIYNNVDSLSLQLKLKEELKCIEIRKRKEIEEDIAHLLDK
jgi:hypothetical protein